MMHWVSLTLLVITSSHIGEARVNVVALVNSQADLPCTLPVGENGVVMNHATWSTGSEQLASLTWNNTDSPHEHLTYPDRFKFNSGNFSLVLLEATYLDSGEYICILSYAILTSDNVTGDEQIHQCTVQLNVIDVPGPPARLVKVEALSYDLIHVSWLAPLSENGSPITGFTLYIRAQDDPQDYRRLTEGASTYRARVIGLLPYTEYNVSVLASNAAGEGESVSAIVRTKAKAPSEHPRFTNMSVTSTSIDVHFHSTPSEKNHGPLLGYVIKVWTEQSRALKTNVTIPDPDLTHYNITNLYPATEFLIHIYLYNEAGLSPPLELAKYTEEGVPSEPQLLDTSSSSHSSLRVVWRRPEYTNGQLLAYGIYWRHGNITGKHRKNLTLNNDMVSHTITGLLPCTEYIINVTAFTAAGEGSAQRPRAAFTEVKGPSAPNITRLTMGNSSGSFEVEWTPPEQQCVTGISHYMLVYNASDTGLSKYLYVDGKQHKYLFTNLTSRNYSVNIAAESAKIYRQNGEFVRGAFSDTRRIHLGGSNQPVDGPMAVIVGVVLGVVCTAVFIALFFIVLYLFKKKFYRRYVRSPYDEEPDPESVRLTKHTVTFPQYANHNKRDEKNPEDTVKVSVAVDKWNQHVARLHADDDFGFSEEYQEIDCGPREDLSVSASVDPENKSKNRYINILAYDHSRVLLRSLPGKPGSDYINANYVDGYNKPQAYIATQGPLPNTHADFWRMVWEQNSTTIVMITNLTERSKRKCDQYWPKEEEQQVSYDHMQVRLLNTYKMAHYTVRVFTLRNTKLKKKSLGERVVLQYHYTDWPDHGVPDYTLPTLAFIRKSVAANSEASSGPMVIHCSAGVGRTGTYIVIESMMKQMKDNSTLNVFSFLSHIRTQRNQLVQTEDQYIFIHDALLEYIESGDTEVKENVLTPYLEQLQSEVPDGETLLARQYRLVTSFRPYDFHMQSALMTVNNQKNRAGALLPVELSRVRLPNRPGEEGSDYINASYLQGYNKNEEFIITQHPMAATLEDFWRMVWEHNSMTVVLLQASSRLDPECGAFWPGDNDTMDCGHFKVSFIEEKKEAKLVTRDFILQSMQDDYECTTRIFSTQGWPESCEPLSESFDLVQTVQKWHHQHEVEVEGPIIVVDKYGGTLAATFCCFFTFYDQHLHEGVIDVYTAAKLYHLKRPGVWPRTEDFLLLYRALESLFGEGSLASEKDSGIGNYKDSYATMPAMRHSILKTINKAVNRTSELTL